MYKGLNIKPPFFEVGPKAFLYGEKMLALTGAGASQLHLRRLLG